MILPSIPPLEQITVSVRLPDYRFHELIGKEIDGLISREELRELDELFRQKELGDAASPPLCGPDGLSPCGSQVKPAAAIARGAGE